MTRKLSIIACLGFLIENWNEGDEIVIVGYSRGIIASQFLVPLACSRLQVALRWLGPP
jgi:uncharacterized protein (DUF2235 family)